MGGPGRPYYSRTADATARAPAHRGDPAGSSGHPLRAAPAAQEGKDLLANGSFEENGGVGTIPYGWNALDEHAGYKGWVAPRAERWLGGIGPRSGKWLAGIDTERMAVDTNGKDYNTPRAALYQTIGVPRGITGTFRIFYNDIGSFGLSYVSTLRLAYTLDSEDIRSISSDDRPWQRDRGTFGGRAATSRPRPGQSHQRSPRTGRSSTPGRWGPLLHRVAKNLADSPTAIGNWAPGELRVVVPPGEGPVQLTLWIGVFDYQNSTERGYWRVDDASFVVDQVSP